MVFLTYTNTKIRKIINSAAAIAAIGALLCIAAILLAVTAFTGAEKAKTSLLPMAEVLELEGNHAARPAYFDINCEPVLVAHSEDEDYYLLTDGSEHYLCGMTSKSYAWVMENLSRSDMRITGVTKVIIDDEAKAQAAQFLSKHLGKEITADTLDNYVGDVHLRATEMTTWQLVKEIYVLNIAFAVPILLISLIMLFLGLSRISSYSKIKCTGDVTPQIVDSQVNSSESLWIPAFELYLAPSFIIGLSHGLTALRYDEIQRLYTIGSTSDNYNKLSLIAVVADGSEYVLSEAMFTSLFREMVSDQLAAIFAICKEHNRSIDCTIA